MSNQPQHRIHTYHCLCSTLLLATPYPLSALPRRAPPSLDAAYILPLPPLSRPQTSSTTSTTTNTTNTTTTTTNTNAISTPHDNDGDGAPLPSLLTANMRPARRALVVRREDGFEKRRLYRCGRCGVGVGYEVLREGKGEGEGGKVVFLMEGGLVETGEMGREGG